MASSAVAPAQCLLPVERAQAVEFWILVTCAALSLVGGLLILLSFAVRCSRSRPRSRRRHSQQQQQQQQEHRLSHGGSSTPFTSLNRGGDAVSAHVPKNNSAAVVIGRSEEDFLARSMLHPDSPPSSPSSSETSDVDEQRQRTGNFSSFTSKFGSFSSHLSGSRAEEEHARAFRRHSHRVLPSFTANAAAAVDDDPLVLGIFTHNNAKEEREAMGLMNGSLFCLVLADTLSAALMIIVTMQTAWKLRWRTAGCSMFPMLLQCTLLGSIVSGCAVSFSATLAVTGKTVHKFARATILLGLWIVPVVLTFGLWVDPRYNGNAEVDQLRFDAGTKCLLSPTLWVLPMLVGLVFNASCFLFVGAKLRKWYGGSASERSSLAKLSFRFLFYVLGWIVCWSAEFTTGAVRVVRECPTVDETVLQGILPLQGALDFLVYVVRDHHLTMLRRGFMRILSCCKLSNEHPTKGAAPTEVDRLVADAHLEYSKSRLHTSLG